MMFGVAAILNPYTLHFGSHWRHAMKNHLKLFGLLMAGCALNLSTCKNLVKAMNGVITFDSELARARFAGSCSLSATQKISRKFDEQTMEPPKPRTGHNRLVSAGRPG